MCKFFLFVDLIHPVYCSKQSTIYFDLDVINQNEPQSNAINPDEKTSCSVKVVFI